MHKRRLLSTDTRGDTIVEVLIAIAVVSAVLGGAFAVARRSTIGARTSQERGEAVKFVEGQLEGLKSALEGPNGDTIFTRTTDFCLDDSLTPRNVNDAACLKNNLYRLRIHPTTISGATGKSYAASATWDRLGGGSQESVEIVYRTYRQ